MLTRAVRARRNAEAEYGSSLSENEDQHVAEWHTSDSAGSSYDTATSVSRKEPYILTDEEEEEEEEPTSSLKDISFGALAKAQESLAPPLRPGKRKHTTDPERDTSNSAPKEEETPTPFRPTKFFKPSHHRTSKHAPQTLSTRHAVPRKRTIIEPSAALKSRDPRFDPTHLHPSTTSRAAESEQANKNYSFLTSYRQSELQALQAQLKAAQNPLPSKKKKKNATTAAPAPASDPETIANLKRQIMSLSSKLANAETKTREREILRAHRAKEREAMREGRKTQPYYLKKGAVRKEIEKERFEGLGKRAREKKEERRRKREKGKEGRGLPRVRRDRDIATRSER
ncbi:hypothetical protein EPUS_04006 [Endocarpon pusillum Z07020]|uniref:rRNA biogenesis protein RRP36 n=1 Tax=Endocarpon pusillum (strain Z07020 / HMAS-L-300199) TaxID=1263415 RepID=U1GC77_ENDPU|nr:uncharacterized protein EPUS_04006 [Endocarpon pusillum Z07020]ERF69301.1 hypothetical protein EPUS_04006 [Endocarpon pusillum Z07020]